jgi:hypothetical protein
MAKKWDGSKVIKEIDEALDRAMAQFLFNTRSKLSAASPVLTGRLASSWNIGRNQPDLSAPPEREAVGPVVLKPYPEKITYGGNWFISSNLPYTQRAAYDPYNGRRGGGDWFTRIENNLTKDAQRIFQRELSKVK